MSSYADSVPLSWAQKLAWLFASVPAPDGSVHRAADLAQWMERNDGKYGKAAISLALSGVRGRPDKHKLELIARFFFGDAAPRRMLFFLSEEPREIAMAMTQIGIAQPVQEVAKPTVHESRPPEQADRLRVRDRIEQAGQHGRLTGAEATARLDRAAAAATVGELMALVSDLAARPGGGQSVVGPGGVTYADKLASLSAQQRDQVCALIDYLAEDPARFVPAWR